MEYRRLGRAGVRVSALGVGCFDFGFGVDEKAAAGVVHCALDKGINFFDTNNLYGDGLSEEFLGKALKGRRSEVVIATKFGARAGRYGPPPPGFGGPNDYGGSRYHIMKAVEDSLRRLQTDHIDLYQMAVPDSETPIEETLRALDDLVHMGKVRYIGCCNFKAYQVCQAMETSGRLNIEAFVTAQDLYNVIDRGIEEELLPCCHTYGLGLIAYRPLRCGFLTGVYRRGKGIPPGSRYHGKPDLMKIQMGEEFLSELNFDILERLENFAGESGHTVGELALAWLLSHARVTTVITGADRPEYIEANIKGTEWKLTPEELIQIEAMV